MSFIVTVLAVIHIVFILLLAVDSLLVKGHSFEMRLLLKWDSLYYLSALLFFSVFAYYFDSFYGASLLVGAVPIAVFYMGSKQRISGKTKLDRRKEDDSTNA